MSEWRQSILQQRRPLHAAAALTLWGVGGGTMAAIGTRSASLWWGYVSITLLSVIGTYHWIKAWERTA